MDAANQPPCPAVVRQYQEVDRLSAEEAVMNAEDRSKLPLAMRHEEITAEDYATVYRVVDEPSGTVGRLRRVPKGIPESQTVPAAK